MIGASLVIYKVVQSEPGSNSYTPFTRYNRLYRVKKHPTGCHTGLKTSLTTSWIRFENRLDVCLHDTAVVKPFWQLVWQPCWTNWLSNPVWQPCWTNSCSFNRLSNRVVQPVWQPAVYTIQPVVKPVVKWVWQPVECLYTRYNRLSKGFDNQFDNRLYRVNGALDNRFSTLV